MTDQTIAREAKLFVYDLHNSAKEHWFKPDEHWEVSLVTAADKFAIEKKYYPVVSASYVPERLTELLILVKNTLKHKRSATEMLLDSKMVQTNQLRYLVAYNPNRQRT